jgi:hypothetical protein
MKHTGDTAFVVSVHYDGPNERLHINLKWQGHHDISAFDLDRLGKVMYCETETENSGWVIVETNSRLNTYLGELQPPFGSPVLEPSFLIIVGDTFPLIESGATASKRTVDLACFWHSVAGCVKEKPLLGVPKCFFEELAKCCRAGRMRTQQGEADS